jgi:hypothetical protein
MIYKVLKIENLKTFEIKTKQNLYYYFCLGHHWNWNMLLKIVKYVNFSEYDWVRGGKLAVEMYQNLDLL